jgi:hypothetical protein
MLRRGAPGAGGDDDQVGLDNLAVDEPDALDVVPVVDDELGDLLAALDRPSERLDLLVQDSHRSLSLGPTAKLVEVAGPVRKVRNIVTEALVSKVLADRLGRRQQLGRQREPLEIVGASLDPCGVLIGRSDDENALYEDTPSIASGRGRASIGCARHGVRGGWTHVLMVAALPLWLAPLKDGIVRQLGHLKVNLSTRW